MSGIKDGIGGIPARSLHGDLRDLGLVAAGAIPGALLRWRLEGIGTAGVGGLRGLVAADFVANMAGCLLIGVVLAGMGIAIEIEKTSPGVLRLEGVESQRGLLRIADVEYRSPLTVYHLR